MFSHQCNQPVYKVLVGNFNMWTNVGKPSVRSYMNVNPVGKTQYDQSNITYDDANTFYDGGDPNSWTKVAKPISSMWTKVAKPS